MMERESTVPVPDGRPLAGLLVVALEQAVAAPLCSSMLANAGARVIKVERHEGDFARGYDDVVHGESAYFAWLNAGKESVRIDLKSEEDRALLDRMVSKADIFIQNLAPGAAARNGFGSDALCARFPGLIAVDISGYGESGAYAKMKAYDLLVQGESGLAAITGTPDEPGRIGVSICDIGCGMYAYAGVLEALLRRARTGTGETIKLSLFDAAANWMTVPLLHYDYGGAAPARVGLNHPSIAPYGVFQTADAQLLISIQNQREWLQFCEQVLLDPTLVDRPDFATNVARVGNRVALDAHISAILSVMDSDVLVDRLRAANIAYGKVNDVPALSAHPQLRRMTVESPTGAIELVANPIQHSSWHPKAAAMPQLGEHDACLRSEFAPRRPSDAVTEAV